MEGRHRVEFHYLIALGVVYVPNRVEMVDWKSLSPLMKIMIITITITIIVIVIIIVLLLLLLFAYCSSLSVC